MRSCLPGPIHVGLNLLFLVPGETGGMEVYARELASALARAQPNVRLTAFVNREITETGGGPWGELFPTVTVPIWARHRVEWVRGEQQLLPRIAASQGIDVIHSLASTAPAWGAFGRVVTIMDVIYRVYPRAHPGLNSLGMRLLVPLAARRSHRIITPSSRPRDALVRLLGVGPEKIDVVPLGQGSPCSVEPTSERTLRGRYELGERQVVLTPAAA